MEKKDLREVAGWLLPITVREEGEKMPVTERRRAPNDFDLYGSRKVYVGDEGELMLTVDRRGTKWSDLKIFRFKCDPDSPGASEFSTQLFRRSKADDIYSHPSSYIHKGMLFSLVTNLNEITLDVVRLNDFEPIVSLSSLANDASKSIKPEKLNLGRTNDLFGAFERTLIGEKRIMRHMSRGRPALLVTEMSDHYELTIASHLAGTLQRVAPGIDCFYSYTVKLDKTELQPLAGQPTDINLGPIVSSLTTDIDRSYRNSHLRFEKRGVEYFGYQPRKTNAYVFKLVELN